VGFVNLFFNVEILLSLIFKKLGFGKIQKSFDLFCFRKYCTRSRNTSSSASSSAKNFSVARIK
jgi:hypothetical protein